MVIILIKIIIFYNILKKYIMNCKNKCKNECKNEWQKLFQDMFATITNEKKYTLEQLYSFYDKIDNYLSNHSKNIGLKIFIEEIASQDNKDSENIYLYNLDIIENIIKKFRQVNSVFNQRHFISKLSSNLSLCARLIDILCQYYYINIKTLKNIEKFESIV